MYRLIDHTGHAGGPVPLETQFEATGYAFKVARAKALIGQGRVHLSIVDGTGKQLMDIKISQRGEGE